MKKKLKALMMANCFLLSCGNNDHPAADKSEMLRDGFVVALTDSGLDKQNAETFYKKLKDWHPGDQEKIYHSFEHTLMVVNLMNEAVLGEEDSISDQQKKLLLFSAAVHDVDPMRYPNTPPRVKATLDILRQEQDYFLNMGLNLDQLITMVAYTDFHPDPNKQKDIDNNADSLSEKYFSDASWPKKWGRILATVDQVSMYIKDWPFAKKYVLNLAFEMRNNPLQNGSQPSTDPTDKYMLKNSYKFLKDRYLKFNQLKLSNEIKNNFKEVLDNFERVSRGEQ